MESQGYWVDMAGGQVPPEAVVGGKEISGEPLYVARARHEGAVLPGKLVPSHGHAYVSWDGLEYTKPNYQILVGGPNNWLPANGSNVPPGAFRAGTTENGETLFVGRVPHEGSLTTGKVQQSHGACYIPFGGKELKFTQYEVLMRYWVDMAGGQVPPEAVVGGKEISGEPLYVARARHEGAVLHGKLVPSHGHAYVSWDGLEYTKPNYQILVGGPNNWLPANGSNVPPGAFRAGTTENGETLFVGRVPHEGSLTTGKVQQSHGACYIPFGGKELKFTQYEVLMR